MHFSGSRFLSGRKRGVSSRQRGTQKQEVIRNSTHLRLGSFVDDAAHENSDIVLAFASEDTICGSQESQIVDVQTCFLEELAFGTCFEGFAVLEVAAW